MLVYLRAVRRNKPTSYMSRISTIIRRISIRRSSSGLSRTYLMGILNSSTTLNNLLRYFISLSSSGTLKDRYRRRL